MMTEQATNASATLYMKLAKVMGALQRIAKSGHNDHFNYDYVTDADVADAVRKELAANKIAFFAHMNNVEQAGKKTTVDFEFTFACGDTGATKSCHWRSEANDSQDKGISKAATSAEKFFLLKTFLLSSGDPVDDPDSDGRAHPERLTDVTDDARRSWLSAPDAGERIGRLIQMSRVRWSDIDNPNHFRNRFAKALRLSNGGSDVLELTQIMINEFGGSANDAWQAVQDYEPGQPAETEG